ncbi:hypothetical protein E3C22_18185 [Jiella endophytica]|uniref:Gp5/Type VI secretion system Vgr protein OB-fold domain-containing protein n=1 Tax=Jiella endophytica TaxID=2558362 RepID=A0A4Y8RGW3_9HYPH|nr:phage baseplate assembly protein V [Jiella endophytica]TFF20817.1 hypothetical protein E3C22_18185 [Jiella endophytica]
MALSPDDVLSMIPWLVQEKAEQDRRNRNRRRKGKIFDEKPEEGLYRVRFREKAGDEPAFDSPWLPTKALSAGGVRIQCEPTIGQWVEVVSESGDITDGWIEMSDFHEGRPRPHNVNGELATDISDGLFRSVLDKGGNETVSQQSRRVTIANQEKTSAGSREHDTDGDVIFNTGGVVRFN